MADSAPNCFDHVDPPVISAVEQCETTTDTPLTGALVRCSSYVDEPLPGTAPFVAHGWILIEHTGAWSHDIFDGETVLPEVSAALKDYADTYGMRIAFIRRHGRQGHCDIEQRRVYISLSLDGIPELWTGSIVHLRDILRWNPLSPALYGCTRCTSISVVCTHGKRDRCCAINGRPVADALDKYSREHWGEEPAFWEISHIAGHRFAPAFMTLPGNYMYGRLTPEEAIAVASAARQGYIDLTKLRGRTSLDAPAQAAELVVAQVLARESQLLTPGLLKATTLVKRTLPRGGDEAEVRVIHPEGRVWNVVLRTVQLPPRPQSCGASPKPCWSWQLYSLHEVSE